MRCVGVIIPVYNARKTLVPTLGRLPLGALRKQGYEVSIFVVDDGSVDGTRQSLEALKRKIPCPLEIQTHEHNRGYGAAQKTGFRASLNHGNTIHALLHADGQYAPEELEILLEPLEETQADVVIGSKFKKGHVLEQGMPLLRAAGIRICDALENRVFGLRGLEYHSGYMAYSSRALELIDFETLTNRFHFDGEMVLSAASIGLRITMVLISACYADGTSSLRVWPYLWELCLTAAKFRMQRYWFQLGQR